MCVSSQVVVGYSKLAGTGWLPEHYWQGVQAVSQAGQALSGPGLVEDRVENPVLLGLEPLQLSKSHDPCPPAFARHDAGGPTTTGGCPRTWQATWRGREALQWAPTARAAVFRSEGTAHLFESLSCVLEDGQGAALFRRPRPEQ